MLIKLMVWFARPVAGHHGIALEANARDWRIDGPLGRREGDWLYRYQPPSFVLEGDTAAAAEFAVAEYLDAARRLQAGEAREDIRFSGDGDYSPETLAALVAALEGEVEVTSED